MSRLEKLQAQRKELAAFLDDLGPVDPSRRDVQAMVDELDRMLNRGPWMKPKPERQKRAAIEPESSVLIATVPKSDNTEIRICVKVWEGRQIVDLRLYSRGKGGGDHKPTGKGISFQPGDLGAVLSGLALAQQYAPGTLEH